AMLKGLVEAFQPDYLVELKPGVAAAHGIAFPEKRIVGIDDVTARDERKRCKIGTDLRSICDDLYRTAFRFVQRHPPEVVIHHPPRRGSGCCLRLHLDFCPSQVRWPTCRTFS